jgi:asparagine synthase (glutamine-hydrolysing)
LYRGLNVLGPGQFIVFRNEELPTFGRYYTYRPWLTESCEGRNLQSELAEITLGIMQRMLDSLDGRPLVVPLSAGNDSRLIVSAARHLGYENVRCFTYGRAGNFEIKTSKVIAEKLGYPWRNVKLTTTDARRFFRSDSYEAYLEFADCCTAAPFVQDMWPIQCLKADGFIPQDAVIANGNSGDFISGLHISSSMLNPDVHLDLEERCRKILEALYEKHFALWRYLRTAANSQRIKGALQCSLSSVESELRTYDVDHGFYEYAEFQDRQCKYVVTGQRIYEFLGHDWRMPLWDNSYLRFWEKVPLEEKAEQSLYIRMLQEENWGGVWSDIPVNQQNIRPIALIPFRWLAKVLHAPIGRERWHIFEQRYLQYWMDVTCNTACAPYRTVASDTRGARNYVAWLTEQYLRRHGIELDKVVHA